MAESYGQTGQSAAPVTARQRAALVRLLADDDPKIRAVAWQRLQEIGQEALGDVLAASRESDDPGVRVGARRYLKEWERREVFRKWVSFCKGDAQSLEQGALLIARSEYPHIDPSTYQATLQGYADSVRQSVASARTNGEAVQVICERLLSEEELRGDREDFDNPENCYLSRALERKRGMPITIAAIVLLVARRLPVSLHGVGMPRHFLLKYRDPRGEVFVDVFHGGKLLTSRDCASFLKASGVTFREEYLQPVSDPEILQRMLGNLLRIYRHAQDTRRSNRVAAMLKLLG